MFRVVLIILSILSEVQAVTYSMCSGVCSVSFSDACGTLSYVDGKQWSCSPFRLPTSWPSAIGSCPGEVVINQTDSTAVCLNRRCSGKMVSTTSGWKCVDEDCPYELKPDTYYGVSYSNYDYYCPLPNCKGTPVKTERGWECNFIAYKQGYWDYLSNNIVIIIGVVAGLMAVEGVVLLVLLRSCLWSKAQNEAKLMQLQTTFPGTPAMQTTFPGTPAIQSSFTHHGV